MKSWFKSKTIWFNLAAWAIPQLLSAVSSLDIPPDVTAAVVAIGNLVLRFVTSESIKPK